MSLSTYQGRGTWEDLSPELLELILQRLPTTDYLKCREVCSSWREVVDHAIASKGRCPPKPQLPLLLILSTDNTANLVSLTQPGVLGLSTQSWEGRISRVQSVHGWLMFQRFYYDTGKGQSCCEISFFNPVSRDRFKLPELSLFSGLWTLYRCNEIRFTYSPHSSEFLLVVLISIDREDEVEQRLTFCKVRHNSWTFIETVETQTNIFIDIAVHDDNLYAITRDVIDFAIVFSIKDVSGITAKRLVMLDPKPIRTMRHFEVKDGISHDTNYDMPRLAVDTTSGELLLVFHVSEIARLDCRKCSCRTKEFRVFGLDLSGPRWYEIKHLGDRFLFFDCTMIRVISARGLDGAQEFNGGNCIFYCFANTLHVDPFPIHDLGVFFLTDKSIRHFTTYTSLSTVRDTWFIPNPW